MIKHNLVIVAALLLAQSGFSQSHDDTTNVTDPSKEVVNDTLPVSSADSVANATGNPLFKNNVKVGRTTGDENSAIQASPLPIDSTKSTHKNKRRIPAKSSSN